jgi:hypothetical protein
MHKQCHSFEQSTLSHQGAKQEKLAEIDPLSSQFVAKKHLDF